MACDGCTELFRLTTVELWLVTDALKAGPFNKSGIMACDGWTEGWSI